MCCPWYERGHFVHCGTGMFVVGVVGVLIYELRLVALLFSRYIFSPAVVLNGGAEPGVGGFRARSIPYIGYREPLSVIR